MKTKVLTFHAAYKSFVLLYNIVGTISHNDFQMLIDTYNPLSQLLLSHFLAAHILLRHISVYEMVDSRTEADQSPLYQIMLGWMHKIDAALPTEYRKYNKWPRSFVLEFGPPIAAVASKTWNAATPRSLFIRDEVLELCPSTL
jgi:hypothetical protein